MKRRYSTRFFLEQAFLGLTRNGVMSIASIAVLMSCLIVLGSFSLLLFNINVNLDKIAELNTSILPFVEENISKFLLGTKPMSEWDAFQAELAKLPIDELLAVYDEIYKRVSQ